MKSFILLAFAVASLSLVNLYIVFYLLLKIVSAGDPGKDKLAKMEKLEYASSNGIITFTDKNYE